MSNPTSPSIRVLLVEDHAAVAKVTGELLRRLGYHVTAAASVAEALHAAGTDGPAGRPGPVAAAPAPGANASPAAPSGTRPFDVVVTDLNLPDGTGTDLMRLLAQQNPLPGIALSAAEPEPHAGSERSLFSSQLVKPVEIDVLSEAIVRAVQESRAN